MKIYENEYEEIDIGHYHVVLSIDDDDHLSLYVKSNDPSMIIEMDTDIDNAGEKGFRFTTEKIENDYIEEEFGK